MAETLHVETRDTRGKRNARRNRHTGKLPAVLYGHGEATVSLLVDAEEFETALRHGARLVKLAGALEEQAFVRALQWDTWGKQVLHVDFTRVSEHERVKVKVPVELRGEAPGIKAGGVVKQSIHSLDIECEATSIPDKIYVNINHLELGQQVTVAELTLPAGTTVLLDADEQVVECHEPVEVEEVAAAGEAEPEVIGRKKEEEGEEE